ncbi:MAG: hypothetical protein ACI9VR_003586 [Cognaticolwellia sp.]|jgi:uncharacterized protein (TIGR00369 family)
MKMDPQAFLARWHELGGLVATLGMDFELNQDGPSAVTMTITPAMSGSPGISHGGAVMALLDTGLGVAAIEYALPKARATSTLEIKVNLLKPAKVGARLRCTAKVVHAGRSHLVIQGEAVDQDGRVLAIAVGTFNLYPIDDLARRTAEAFGTERG